MRNLQDWSTRELAHIYGIFQRRVQQILKEYNDRVHGALWVDIAETPIQAVLRDSLKKLSWAYLWRDAPMPKRNNFCTQQFQC